MRLPSKVCRAIKTVYPRFGLRDSDVLLASFPKSGNTWMRFIWANMVSIMELGGREVDFVSLNTHLVAEYDSHTYGTLEFDCLPRVVKTHYPFDVRAFGKNRSIYIIRHPGDVVVSHFEYRAAQGKCETSTSALKALIRDCTHGVPAWCEHVQSWRSKADVMVQYEELKADPVSAVHRTLAQLGLDHVHDDIVRCAVERSSFDTLRRIEDERGRPNQHHFSPNYRFMRSGRTGEWKERFEIDDIEYLQEQISENALTDLYSA